MRKILKVEVKRSRKIGVFTVLIILAALVGMWLALLSTGVSKKDFASAYNKSAVVITNAFTNFRGDYKNWMTTKSNKSVAQNLDFQRRSFADNFLGKLGSQYQAIRFDSTAATLFANVKSAYQKYDVDLAAAQQYFQYDFADDSGARATKFLQIALDGSNEQEFYARLTALNAYLALHK
jgi:hypothetical protein